MQNTILLTSLAALSAGFATTPCLTQSRGFDERGTNVYVSYYENAENWTLKALVLSALGEHWHPVGGPAVLDALQAKDPRLVAFGVEALRTTRADVLRSIADHELVEELVQKTLAKKNDLLRKRVTEVLKKLAPDADAEDRRQWQRWWRGVRKEWQPTEWPPLPEAKEDNEKKTVTAPLIERALDLQDAGLDVMICIDTTGSMQRTINESRDAIEDVVTILGGIAPELRLGLVHYRDFGDMSDGAKLLLPLSRKVTQVRDKLGKIVANGGGDAPERVEKGLEFALDRTAGWKASTNKLVLVIGDAPPHAATERALLKMVSDAHKNPTLSARGRPTTGKKKKMRPFVISTMAVGPTAERSFKEIAKAGGGAYVRMFQARGPRGPRGGASEPQGARGIVEHVLAMSFGSQWQQALKRFVKVFFEYQDAGFLAKGRRRAP